MKHTKNCALLLCSLILICCDRPIAQQAAASQRVDIFVLDGNANAVTILRMAREPCVDGLPPSCIHIKSASLNEAIPFSTSNGVDATSTLDHIYGPKQYNGQIVYVKRNHSELVYSGSQKNVMYYVVDEKTTLDDLIKIVNSTPKSEYAMIDIRSFKECMSLLSVPIHHGVLGDHQPELK
jgi:hypothetical protein